MDDATKENEPEVDERTRKKRASAEASRRVKQETLGREEFLRQKAEAARELRKRQKLAKGGGAAAAEVAAAAQHAATAAAPPPQMVDIAGQLTKLAELWSGGALTDAEFAAAKARVLAVPPAATTVPPAADPSPIHPPPPPVVPQPPPPPLPPSPPPPQPPPMTTAMPAEVSWQQQQAATAAAASSSDDDDGDEPAADAAAATDAAHASNATFPASNTPPATNAVYAATLLTLPGVMSVADMNALSDSLGVSAARALSVSDTLKLHGVLEAPADSAELMRALRRLAMAPLTCGLSASTRIDEAVAVVQADESASEDARELSARILNVWRRQLEEERRQHELAHRPGPNPRSGPGREACRACQGAHRRHTCCD